ncbi:MAG TPA: hypothetical protein VF396_08835, partial [Bradyrhizobium sp.]
AQRGRAADMRMAAQLIFFEGRHQTRQDRLVRVLSRKITASREKAPDDAGAFRPGFGLNQ